MNGIHDMGGMQGMGPIRYEKNEPVFHARWEGRVYAMMRAMRAWRKWNIDAGRHDIELIPALDYLRMSYFERWFTALQKQVVRYGFVTPEELKAGKAAPGTGKARPALTPDAARRIGRGIPSAKEPAIKPVFQVGDRVRAKNMTPLGHTRLPRYARDKVGVVYRDHGVYAFPDTNAHYAGENRQHVYSVSFTARELWGEQGRVDDTVHLDLFDSYLEKV